MKGDRVAADRRLEDLVRDHALDESAARRVAVGDPAAVLGQIANEEAADVIVVGGRTRLGAQASRQSACPGAGDGNVGAGTRRAAAGTTPARANDKRRGALTSRHGTAHRCRSTGVSSRSTRVS